MALRPELQPPEWPGVSPSSTTQPHRESAGEGGKGRQRTRRNRFDVVKKHLTSPPKAVSAA